MKYYAINSVCPINLQGGTLDYKLLVWAIYILANWLETFFIVSFQWILFHKKSRLYSSLSAIGVEGIFMAELLLSEV